MISELSFLTEQRDGACWIMACVNGRPVADLIEEFERAKGFADPSGGYSGLVPAYFSHQSLFDYFLGRHSDEDEFRYLLGCQCGEVGCWPIIAEIEADDERVCWKAFRQPHRSGRDYSQLCPFVFDRAGYEKALMLISKIWDDPN